MPRPLNNIVFLSGQADPLKANCNDRRFMVVDLPTSRPKSAIASRMAREPEFPEFLASIGHNATDQEAITAAICAICEVASRADLDRDPDAVARFEARIGMPYAAFRQRRLETFFRRRLNIEGQE